MKKPTGYVIFNGKSQIDNAPIIGVVILKSTNAKTGNMGQLHIIREDVAPHIAVKTGQDVSVCGDCKHRAVNNGACYVTTFQGPLQVYKSYKKGSYPFAKDLSIFEGMKIRFGAYGDPYALPMALLTNLKAVVENNTSYTHQWKQGSKALKQVSMASVDSIEEQKSAVNEGWRTFRVTSDLSDIQSNEILNEGWRTFRVTSDLSDIQSNEILCPNTSHNVQCIDCGLCNGNISKAKNIVIEVHGQKKKRFINKEELTTQKV
jgi:hypothetical protein